MKSRNRYRMIIGFILILSGLVAFFMTGGGALIGTLMLAAGFAFLIAGISRHHRYGDYPETDERSRKIGAYGLSYAWLTGLLFNAGLFWLDYLGIFRLSAQIALSASILVLAFSAVVYQSYLFRKGDTD